MFKLEIDTDNEAFDNARKRRSELARILREIANDLLAGTPERTIRDINGNRVGAWKLHP